MARIDAHLGRRGRVQLVLVFGLFAFACAPAAEAPVRSPSKDYPLPPPQTSDGQVVGADNRPPEDRLNEGASTAGPAPGWSVDEHGVKYDPERPARGTTPPDPAAGGSAR